MWAAGSSWVRLCPPLLLLLHCIHFRLGVSVALVGEEQDISHTHTLLQQSSPHCLGQNGSPAEWARAGRGGGQEELVRIRIQPWRASAGVEEADSRPESPGGGSQQGAELSEEGLRRGEGGRGGLMPEDVTWAL